MTPTTKDGLPGATPTLSGVPRSRPLTRSVLWGRTVRGGRRDPGRVLQEETPLTHGRVVFALEGKVRDEHDTPEGTPHKRKPEEESGHQGSVDPG